MKNFIVFILLILIFYSCHIDKNISSLNAEKIIESAIKMSGTNHFEYNEVHFQFRDKSYISVPTCEGFKFRREFTNGDEHVVDELYSGKLKRNINETEMQLSDSLAFLYSESINSIFYFVQLPYRLQDKAVNKELMGIENDSIQELYKVKINFNEEGGGEDFEDVYYYWFNTENFQIEYLAYSFKVNGGGIRFRRVIDDKKIDTIQFLNYENYKPKEKDLELKNSLYDFLNNKYELLSIIEKDSIYVNRVKIDCK